ncbi:adhesive domain-containing protein [Schinkia azotoformans]|uniref:adhesive domain-containing protein n=1 Tax=Schinkia azotoformans TaxID=1454 RepID=UPI002DB864CC|nr:adhesive domain-containing protein [Schinkia azotoformans]MEC1718140.1 hypothetical protein [Schinkia azotoformans]MEC1742098.1 hypothetical protein [Schinkia azotoformans]MEC1748032.1 hypothetical protein [Schinkia azotoformans]MEC1765014.1 hypothetical protein [Schinkia azotoformans]MEC1785940.1 hypothetical protein [Schinkia azotoformans]
MKAKKSIATLLTFLLLVMQCYPFSTIFAGGRVEAAETLANVELLTGVNLNATLNSGTEEHYELGLKLSGRGVADIKLLGKDRVAIFYAPDLAGKLSVVEKANVEAQILPITMEDLPALRSLVGNLTKSLTDLIAALTTGLNKVLKPIIYIDGLDKLYDALDNLNNLDTALTDLTVYKDQVEVVVEDNGIIKVDFSDGLGNHLQTAVNDVVVPTVTDVLDAVDHLNIEILGWIPFLGDLLSNLVGNILNPLKEIIVSIVNSIVEPLTTGVLDITEELAGLQVIGETTITVNALVDKPAGVNGEVKIYGAAVTDGIIDVKLLSKVADEDSIYIMDEFEIEIENYELEFKESTYEIDVKRTDKDYDEIKKIWYKNLYDELKVTHPPGEEHGKLPKIEDLELTWEIKEGGQVGEIDETGKVKAKGVGEAVIVVTARDKNDQVRKATAEVLVNLKNVEFSKSLYVYPDDGKDMFEKLIIEPEGFNKTREVFEWSLTSEDSTEGNLALKVDENGKVKQNGDKSGFVILKVKLKEKYDRIDGKLDDPYDQAMTLIKINKIDGPIGDPVKEW